MSTVSRPISGWQGKIEVSNYTVRSTGESHEVAGETSERIIAPVTNVTVNGSFDILLESRLGTRKKVVIPTPVEFSGTFDVINTTGGEEDNYWIFELMMGADSQYDPIHFTLIASDKDYDFGISLKECYIDDFRTEFAANGAMNTRFSFKALEMSLIEFDEA
jgi:hypothetical protein